MSKTRQQHPSQLSLLSVIHSTSPACDTQIPNIVATAIKNSAYGREKIAERISEISGQAISRAQLDAYISPTHVHRFPAELIVPFCLATGDFELIRYLNRMLGILVATPEEQEYARIGRAQIESDKAREKAEALKTLRRLEA